MQFRLAAFFCIPLTPLPSNKQLCFQTESKLHSWQLKIIAFPRRLGVLDIVSLCNASTNRGRRMVPIKLHFALKISCF